MIQAFVGELLGTSLLILLGNGVVANVLLKDTIGNSSGWIVVTFGWAIGVFVGVFAVSAWSGAHLNPAVSLALAISGKFDWSLLPLYILAQMLGAMLGSLLVVGAYRLHFLSEPDGNLKKACFCTSPAIRDYKHNFLSEMIGTFVLVVGVLFMAAPEVGLGAVDALPVALLVLGIGLSLGGATGYAINPARDLGPRILHAILPMKNKVSSDFSYAWVPVLGPLTGATLAAFFYHFLQILFA